MPSWIHGRAEHLLAKNPSMPKSMAFAVATQQSHALGKSPKGYGTAEGKRTAKAKFDTPKDDQKKANPGGLKSDKLAGVTSTHRVVVDTTRDGASALKALLENIERLGAPGHSFSILSDDKVNLGGWDGDGYMHMQRIAVEPLKEKQASLATAFLAPLPAFVREKLAFAAPTALKSLTSTLSNAAHSIPQAIKAAPAAAKGVITGATPHLEHVNELAGLGVLALPGVDTLQSRARARLAGDTSEHGAERRQLLGEGAHAALDVAGLGMLAGPAASRLMKHGFAPSAYGGNTAQNPPGMKGRSLLPPFKAPELEQKEAGVGVGAGMTTSQYSGPLSYGPFKMVSGIPAFRSPAMTKHEPAADPAEWMVGGDKQASQRLYRELDAGNVTLSELPSELRETIAPLRDTNYNTALNKWRGRASLRSNPSVDGMTYSGADPHDIKMRGIRGKIMDKKELLGAPKAPGSALRKGLLIGVPAALGVAALAAGAHHLAKNKTAASTNTATGGMSPVARLSTTQRVGAPKTTGFSGPSIADISKPKGFGKPISGAQKNQL